MRRHSIGTRFTLVLALAVSLLLLVGPAMAQTGTIRGQVFGAPGRVPLGGVNITLLGAGRGALTGADGRFELSALAPGAYNLQASLLGYQRRVLFELEVTPVRPTELEIVLEEEVLASDSVSVTASPFVRRVESPTSLSTISAAEIARFPGGGRDLSKVLQSAPGVAGTASFRNDILIRGGAPNENRFYLDGIEVPNINHFATQGSSGGPVGMIEVNFIREVELHTSAFPVNRGNALSSVMDLRMRSGNADRLATSATLGASDLGLSLEGPIGDRTTFIASARRSYLQLLFQALGLPFLPTYNDAQFQVRTRLDERNDLTLLGLGAIDRFTLDKSANDTEFKRYLLDNLPITPQWNYTLGARWQRRDARGSTSTVLSRNQLDNRSTKYEDNDDRDPAGLIQDYRSRETENKLRVERSERRGRFQLLYGLGFEADEYTTDTDQRTATPTGVIRVDYASRLTLSRGALFLQASRGFLRERLALSAGLRTEVSDYSPRTRDPLRQLSPRFAASYAFSERLRWNASVGRYQQLPAYTVLGFRDSSGALANRERGVATIRADHFVGGLEYLGRVDSRLTAEAFLKRYADYPFLLREGISLANLGADFGVIGNAPAISSGRGRAYGFELSAQQKLRRGYFGNASYTFVRSEFTTRDGSYQPSAWDNRHIASLTGGKRFANGFELGARWRYLGGAPYTPDDVALSSQQSVWDVTGRAVPDYAQLNSRRNGPLHQLDMRLDKRWFWRGSSIELYLDVQNVYAFTPRLAPILVVDRDAAGAPITDPADPSAYLTHRLREDAATPLPTLGITIAF